MLKVETRVASSRIRARGRHSRVSAHGFPVLRTGQYMYFGWEDRPVSSTSEVHPSYFALYLESKDGELLSAALQERLGDGIDRAPPLRSISLLLP